LKLEKKARAREETKTAKSDHVRVLKDKKGLARTDWGAPNLGPVKDRKGEGGKGAKRESIIGMWPGQKERIVL